MRRPLGRQVGRGRPGGPLRDFDCLPRGGHVDQLVQRHIEVGIREKGRNSSDISRVPLALQLQRLDAPHIAGGRGSQSRIVEPGLRRRGFSCGGQLMDGSVRPRSLLPRLGCRLDEGCLALQPGNSSLDRRVLSTSGVDLGL